MSNFKDDRKLVKRISRNKRTITSSSVHKYGKAISVVRKLCFALVGFWAVAAVAQASTISINATANPNNVIQLDGELSATITHTAQGIAIEIPGVEVTLDCPTTDACTVSVGAASATAGYGSGETNTAGGSTDAGGTSGGSTGANSGTGDGTSSTGSTDAGGTSGGSTGADSGTSDGTSSTGSSNSGSSGGALDLNELCSSDRPTEYNSRQISWDKYCPTYTPTDTSGNTGGDSDGTAGGGATVGGNNDSDGSDDCPGVGYDCYNHGGSGSNGTNEVVSNAVAFPNGGNRQVQSIASQTDFGSAGRNASGGTVYVTIAKGGVTVAGMTMSSEEEPVVGSLNFGVTANQPVGADLRAWISKEPDGGRISNFCSYQGYSEGAIRFSMDGSRACNLERGGSYYVNMALCKSDAGDWDCRSANAMTAEDKAVLVFEVKYD